MYKPWLLIAMASLFFGMQLQAQCTEEIRNIDSLVDYMHSTELLCASDSSNVIIPETGLGVRTLQLSVYSDRELKKLVSLTQMLLLDADDKVSFITCQTYYFDNNELIKVDEHIKGYRWEKNMTWYYEKDRPLFQTFEQEAFEDRALGLLTISKVLVKNWFLDH